MARIGTAFVEIKPDLSGFGAGLRPKIEAEVKAATAGLGGDIHKKVKVDVDRSSIGRIGSSISTAFRGATAAIGGLLGNLPVIGGLFEGLTSAMGTSALGASGAAIAIAGLSVVLIALAASLASAVLGLGALAVALGAALGPALIVTIGAFTRFAEILKAVKDHEQNAGTEARAVAGAHQQLQAATDAVAQAQGNLKDQTTAAYAAWADSIENVKDDLLGVQDAQSGIVDAHLALRDAQQALKDFKKEGATGLDAVFKKFTNVNVDFSGLRSALSKVRDAHGNALSGDDELHLEHLIQNVRNAKLGEKHATDALHDSTVKLAADRKTEADYARKGIAAYKPYTAATKQLAGAERSLASARRGLAGATARQAKAWKDLSPMEKTFGRTLIKLGDTLKAVFEPVMNALLPGVTKGLQIFADFATDPKIKSALVETGKALGGAFAQFATLLTTPEMRDLFKKFADAGVKIIPDLVDAFGNLFTILARVAGVATGKDGLEGVIKSFDTWTRRLKNATSNTKELRGHVQHLIDETKTWFNRISDVLTGLYNIGKWINDHKSLIAGFAALWGFSKILSGLHNTYKRLTVISEFLAAFPEVIPVTITVAVLYEVNKKLAELLGIKPGDTVQGHTTNPTSGALNPLLHGRNPFAVHHENHDPKGTSTIKIPKGSGGSGQSGLPNKQGVILVPAGQRPAPDLSPAHAPSGRTFRAAVTNQVNNINITTATGAMPDGRFVGGQIERAIAGLA